MEILHITGIGSAGDGEAETADGPVHVPFALPGETVRVERQGKAVRLTEVLEPSGLRIAPQCRHFGRCGGCAMQHLDPESYIRWKENRVMRALRDQGVSARLEPMLPCRPATRRRAVFTARRLGGEMAVGFSEAGSHRLVAVEECPVLVPEITQRLPQLRELAALAGAKDRPIRITVTSTRTGLDIVLSGMVAPAEKRRQAMIEFALARRIARLTLEDEILIEPQKPMVLVGNVLLSPPPGSFLQATEEAEAAMSALVAGHLAGCRHVFDLFAGSGTFALRLARHAVVHAVDSEQAALDALDRACRNAQGLKSITVERRDLFRRPLRQAELAACQGLVFDPPRAGASAQVDEIARSRVRKVAAVSCNPATLARDLASLLAGGYQLRSITPIDQFLWSPHVEVVALLER